mgnify:CR=1 FL=1
MQGVKHRIKRANEVSPQANLLAPVEDLTKTPIVAKQILVPQPWDLAIVAITVLPARFRSRQPSTPISTKPTGRRISQEFRTGRRVSWDPAIGARAIARHGGQAEAPHLWKRSAVNGGVGLALSLRYQFELSYKAAIAQIVCDDRQPSSRKFHIMIGQNHAHPHARLVTPSPAVALSDVSPVNLRPAVPAL